MATPNDVKNVPNDRLRMARLRLLSPTGSGRPMSRAELADAVNARFHEMTGLNYTIDASYVGNLERGQTRWPQMEARRQAFREVLGVAADTDIGLWPYRSHHDRAFLKEHGLVAAADIRDTAMTGPAGPAVLPISAAATLLRPAPAPASAPAMSCTVEATDTGGVRIVVELEPAEPDPESPIMLVAGAMG